MTEGVCCIIPSFNGATYLGAAIDSVLKQTLPADEIIVVDDGSTDRTGNLVSSFSGKVRYVYQAHAGVSAARNRGIRETDCDLVCFLDSDDTYHPLKIETQVSALRSSSGIDFWDAQSRYFWSEELTDEEIKADARYPYPFWRKCFSGHVTTWLVRRSVFDHVGLFDESLRFSEDNDWLLRYYDSGRRSSTVSRCLSYRRLHPRNTTVKHRRDQVRSLARVFKKAQKRRSG